MGAGRTAVAAVLASAAFQASLYLWPGQAVRVSGVALLLGVAWAAAVHARAAWRSRGYVRRVWGAAAVGMGLWLAAEAFFARTEIVANHPVGGPSPGDVPNLLAFVFAVLGMLLFPSAPRTLAGKIRMALDGLLLTSSLFGLAWLGLLGRMAGAPHDASWSPLKFAYPTASIVVLSVALLLIAGGAGGSGGGNALTVFCGGIAAAAFSGLASLFLAPQGSPTSDTGADGALLLAVLLIGRAPSLPLPEAHERPWNPSGTLGHVLPYVPIGLVVPAAAVSFAVRGLIEPAVFWAGVVLIGSVLGRQFFTLRMNAALATELEGQRARLAHQAAHDPLTGLGNRALLAERMWIALTEQREEPGQPALLLIDLDGFKAVNDTLGHPAGDALLVAVADRLRGCARTGDTVARLGGDEFAVLLTGVVDPAHAGEVATRILDRLSAPVPLADGVATVGASIGVAVAHAGHHGDPDLLLREADLALYAAKSGGKGRYRMADNELSASSSQRIRIDQELRAAIAADELRLYYQPIVELPAGRIIGVEALLRWQHREHGLLTPGDFLPAAETAGLMPEVDRWTLRHACRQVALWRRYAPGLTVSVNVSADHVTDPGLVSAVTEALSGAGLPPQALVLELTETALVADVAGAGRVLRELAALGVGIALDDFGTGYSSLTYLRNLPIDTVKIDRSFVSDLGGDGDDAVTRAILTMVESLGLRRIAEGVETGDQADALDGLRCPLAQGYFFSRPLPPERLAEQLPGPEPLVAAATEA